HLFSSPLPLYHSPPRYSPPQFPPQSYSNVPSTPFLSSLQLQLLSPRTLESYPTTLLPIPLPGIHAPRRPWPEAQSANNEEREKVRGSQGAALAPEPSRSM